MARFFYFFIIILGLSTHPCIFAAAVAVPGALSHENSVTFKQVIHGSIPIQNQEDAPIKVKITLADYLFNAKGESFFPEAGSSLRSNSSWIKTGETQITIAPNTTYNFSYTLEVPNNPLLEGTYWSISPYVSVVVAFN